MEAGQGWHGVDAAATEEYVPAGHIWQNALLFAPARAENLRIAE